MTNVKNVMSSEMWNNMWFGGEDPVERWKNYANLMFTGPCIIVIVEE